MRRHLWTLILTAAAAQPAAIELPGLKEPAEILVDRWGVPHIYARNFDDAGRSGR